MLVPLTFANPPPTPTHPSSNGNLENILKFYFGTILTTMLVISHAEIARALFERKQYNFEG